MPKSSEKTDRNIELYQDVRSHKLTQVELVAKYGISAARIYQLKKRFDIRGIPVPEPPPTPPKLETQLVPDYDKLDKEGDDQ